MATPNRNTRDAGNGAYSPSREAGQADLNRKKYCRFKRSGIKYIDYKDPNFLLKFVNDQGKLLPRRLTGTSSKFQRKVAQAVKRARHLALMPYVADSLK